MLQTENRITEQYEDSGLQDRMARPDKRHTCLTAVQGKANTGKKTRQRCCKSSSWGYYDPMQIIIKMRTHEIITTKESYPHNSYTGLAGLAWMCHWMKHKMASLKPMRW